MGDKLTPAEKAKAVTDAFNAPDQDDMAVTIQSFVNVLVTLTIWERKFPEPEKAMMKAAITTLRPIMMEFMPDGLKTVDELFRQLDDPQLQAELLRQLEGDHH